MCCSRMLPCFVNREPRRPPWLRGASGQRMISRLRIPRTFGEAAKASARAGARGHLSPLKTGCPRWCLRSEDVVYE
jgi:hypothetical protein